MSDTTHATLAALLGAIPTNAPYTQDDDGGADVVTSQLLRDIAASLSGLIPVAAYGQLTVQAQSSGQAISADTYEPVDGWDTEGPSSSNVTMSMANGRATVDTAGVYAVMFAFSITLASAAWTTLSVAVNGTEVGPEYLRRNSGTDAGAVGGMFTTTLAADDYVAVHVKTQENETITYEGASFLIYRIA